MTNSINERVTMHHLHRIPGGKNVYITAIFNHDGSECIELLASTTERPLTEAEITSIITPEILAEMIYNHANGKRVKRLELVK